MSPRSLYVLALLSQGLNTWAQTMQANFNQVINLNGDMNLNSVSFPDGSKIETFSQTQRQMLVNQNQAPLPGNQVTGSTGNPFMQLSQNSLIIQTNGGTDLVGAQIELPLRSQMMQQNNISPDNTFVAKLAPDRRSWMIMETIKSVNITDNTARIVKMNNIDGEYIALGRQTVETGLSLTQFSSNTNQGFNVSGSGIQENEFTDGFRMSVRSTQPMQINTNVVNGVSSTMLAALQPGTQSVNNYRYLVNTNLGGVVPNINRMVAVVQLPINPVRLQTVARNMGANPNSNIRLSVAQRGILINPGGAQSIQGQKAKRQNQNQNGQQQQGQNNGNNSNNGQQQQGQNNGNNNNGQQQQGQNNGNNNNGQQQQGQNNGNNNNNNNNNNNGINQGTNTNGNNPAATRLLLSPTFTPIAANAVLDQMNGRLAIPVGQLDGEYIITVSMAQGNEGTPQGQAPLAQGQQGQLQGQGQPQGQGQLQGQGQQQGQLPAGEPSPQAQRPAGEPAPQGQASPQGQQLPAGEPALQGQAPAGEPTAAGVPAPQAAREAPRPAGASAPAPAPAGAAEPAGAAPRPAKRQAAQQQPSGGVLVTMGWIDAMAQMAQQGLPVNVGSLMDQLISQNGGTPQGVTGSNTNAGVAGLVSGLKEKRFSA